MPKKKAHQFGHGQKKSKKKTKYNSKPTPAEEPKKDEEDTIEVDVRGDPGDSSTGTPSEFQLSSANMTNPVAAVDKSSGERHVQPADAFASCNDPPKGQDAPTIGMHFYDPHPYGKLSYIFRRRVSFSTSYLTLLSRSVSWVACPFHRGEAARRRLGVAQYVRRFRAPPRQRRGSRASGHPRT